MRLGGNICSARVKLSGGRGKDKVRITNTRSARWAKRKLTGDNLCSIVLFRLFRLGLLAMTVVSDKLR